MDIENSQNDKNGRTFEPPKHEEKYYYDKNRTRLGPHRILEKYYDSHGERIESPNKEER